MNPEVRQVKTQYVHLSDINVALGDYVATLNYVGYDNPKKWDIKPHKHMNYELHAVSEGTGKLMVADRTFDITPGSMYLTGPGVVHGQQSDCMDEYGMRFDLEYRPSAAGEKSDRILARNLIDRPFFFLCKAPDFWHLQIGEIIREAHMQLPGFRQKLTGIFMSFIVELGRLSAEISGNDLNPPDSQTIGAIDIKSRLDTYFFGFNQAVTPEMIQSELHITRRSFSRLMQKYYGMTYTEKMNEQRIAYAKELLLSGTPFCKVWQSAGFNSPQYFARVFKKQVGMTPTQFSKKQTSDEKQP